MRSLPESAMKRKKWEPPKERPLGSLNWWEFVPCPPIEPMNSRFVLTAYPPTSTPSWENFSTRWFPESETMITRPWKSRVSATSNGELNSVDLEPLAPFLLPMKPPLANVVSGTKELVVGLNLQTWLLALRARYAFPASSTSKPVGTPPI